MTYLLMSVFLPRFFIFYGTALPMLVNQYSLCCHLLQSDCLSSGLSSGMYLLSLSVSVYMHPCIGEWLEVIQNGEEWLGLMGSGQGWLEMVRDGGWSGMVGDGQGSWRIVSNGQKCTGKVRNVLRNHRGKVKPSLYLYCICTSISSFTWKINFYIDRKEKQKLRKSYDRSWTQKSTDFWKIVWWR